MSEVSFMQVQSCVQSGGGGGGSAGGGCDGVIDQSTKWPHQESPPLSGGSDTQHKSERLMFRY